MNFSEQKNMLLQVKPVPFVKKEMASIYLLFKKISDSGEHLFLLMGVCANDLIIMQDIVIAIGVGL